MHSVLCDRDDAAGITAHLKSRLQGVSEIHLHKHTISQFYV